TDGSVWRGLTRLLMSLRTPAEVFDDEFVARVRRAGSAGTTGNRTPERVPEGPPGREDLVRLVAGACAAGRR
ncbi:MAG TPA: hypothetical protein VFT95_17395, partial [Micromonosporaceae bacterium]|nr:hypothetical protein [Micromonosporaceae bacterium]